MSDLMERLKEFAEQAANNLNLFILEVDLKNISSNNPILTIMADSPKGISIGECAKLSSEIGDFIDAYQVLPQDYRLDVSSPGMSIPIVHQWQLDRAIGKKVRATICEAESEKKTSIEGIMVSYADKTYVLKTGKKKENQVINRDDVTEIKVIPQW